MPGLIIYDKLIRFNEREEMAGMIGMLAAQPLFIK
jgi:hypothetical protein